MVDGGEPRSSWPSLIIGILLIAFGVLAVAGYACAAVDRWPPLAGLGEEAARAAFLIAIVALPLLKPSWGIYCVFLALPFFGNRPGGRYMEILDIQLGASIVGLTVHALRHRLPLPRGLVYLISWVCVFTAFVALVPAFPGFLPRWGEVSDATLTVVQAATSREDDPLYSLNSACLLALAVAWAMALAWVRTDRLALKAGRAIIVAFLVVTLFGILDFHRIVDLDRAYLLRLDPRSLDDAAFKSLFWNPGWFAEYFSMAFGVTLGFSMLESSWRRALWLGVLAVTYGYFLANRQRGGVVAINAAIAIVAVQEVWRVRHRRLALSLAVVGLLVLVVSAVAVLAYLPQRSVWLLGLRRLIDSPGDEVRRKLVTTAIQMWHTAPVLGIGEGAFAWRYREFVPHGSPLEVLTYGDAHNTWLQILATRGIVGLVGYVSLWVAVCWTIFNALRDERRSLALPIASALTAFFVYSFVQGMFYLQAIQVLFWGLIGLLPVNVRRSPGKRSPLIIQASLGLALVVVAFALRTSREPIKHAWGAFQTQPRGFYPVETWDHGRVGRWSSKVGTLCLYPIDPLTVVEFQAQHPDIFRRPVQVTFAHEGTVLDRVQVKTNDVIRRQIPVRVVPQTIRDSGRPFGECDVGAFTLTVEVDRVWSPSSFRVSDDWRHLGVAVVVPSEARDPSD